MYSDRLNGLLPEEDFRRILSRIKVDRAKLEVRLRELECQLKKPARVEDRAKELVERFIETAGESRELLVSLVERVELTASKEIIIKFRFPQLAEMLENMAPAANPKC